MNTNLQQFYQSLSQDESTQFVLNSDVIDDWLADELCQSGMLLNSASTATENQTSLPHSPPISPSSVNTTTKPSSHQQAPQHITLFPEIQQATTTKKPILPKIATTNTNIPFPKIAPRPITSTAIPQQQQPPIKIEPCFSNKPKRTLTEKEQDEIILKRQKNTDAARRSRLKKLMKMEHLEKQVSELETDKQNLTTRIAVLESEKFGLESKSLAHENRIKILEAQLAEAHRALTKS